MIQTQILLRQLGIQATHKGYHYLLSSIELAIKDDKVLRFHTKSLYPTVARMYQTTPSSVERNIRTVITHCWNCTGREKLLEIAPYELKSQPTLGQFLDIVYWYLKFMEM